MQYETVEPRIVTTPTPMWCKSDARGNKFPAKPLLRSQLPYSHLLPMHTLLPMHVGSPLGANKFSSPTLSYNCFFQSFLLLSIISETSGSSVSHKIIPSTKASNCIVNQFLTKAPEAIVLHIFPNLLSSATHA